jgi:glycosyltransferase involved in cell wall biosynthesis
MEQINKLSHVKVKEYENSCTDLPLVSICIVTYQHVDFIAQCLDSVLMQKTNFSYEIILGEDESTDGTREICIDYAKKYPDKIRLFLHSRENNIKINNTPTGRFNFLYGLSQARGKYIALCEGDDYWIDSEKLQKQVDFLEKNRDYGMVVTDYNKFYQEEKRTIHNFFSLNKYKSEVKFLDYVIDGSTIGTQTVLIKTDILKLYFDEISLKNIVNFIVGDTPLWLFVLVKSKVGVIPDVTAEYRVLNNSACHFEDPTDHYEFVMKGFEIPEYFLDNYSMDIQLKRKLKVRKHIATLSYAYKTNNKELFNQTFKELKISEIKPKTLLWKIGAQNKHLKHLINSILKLR